MRSVLVAVTTLMLFAAGAAQAKVSITVDKDNQMMTVAVDGVDRYHWPVSTGNPSHETPNGSFRTFRMEADHFSKEFDDAPMPHSIFFTKIGHAIHGTESERSLGMPVSHGCVRLSRANATTLYALVQEQGVLNTTVTLTGSSTVAIARKRGSTAVARAEPAQPDQQYQQQQYQQQYQQQPYQQPQYQQPQYSDAGQPVVLTPQPQYFPGSRPAQQPQQRADDGYIYPADGSSTDQRYPAPRGTRRGNDGQAYYQQQPGYYQQQQPQAVDAYGNPYQQRSYYQQQQRYYYPN
ncbi:L,D-transpeptidase [Bradyrhizobium sp.]|uniref:L,D-transpeptidase n=1 Tax=Bradyrhizobium sp. TaxID=376 RepID=UPI002D361A35|nr:L,D-transpeptidase [Bradyrhizobium sp.]HZR71626.1 L,D-transpeptidase [Bradyrhizobium sp.]